MKLAYGVPPAIARRVRVCSACLGLGAWRWRCLHLASACLTVSSAARSQLLAHLEGFSSRLLDRLQAAEAQARDRPAVVSFGRIVSGCDPPPHPRVCQVDAVARSSIRVEVAVNAEVLRFDALADSQFVENVRLLACLPRLRDSPQQALTRSPPEAVRGRRPGGPHALCRRCRAAGGVCMHLPSVLRRTCA
jgi:hypothetical protein